MIVIQFIEYRMVRNYFKQNLSSDFWTERNNTTLNYREINVLRSTLRVEQSMFGFF